MLVGYQELYDKIVELKEASQKSHTLIAKRYRHAKSLTSTEEKMNTTALKKDWLAGSAVIAFLGALMLAQTGDHRAAFMNFPLT